MTNAEFFEFIVVLIEIGAFMMILSVGAVVLEVIIPKLTRRIAVRAKIRKLKRRIMSGITVQSG